MAIKDLCVEIKEHYNEYNNHAYVCMAVAIMAPVIGLGNVIDLCTLGLSKRITPSFKACTDYFWRGENICREENNTLFFKGAAGILHAVAAFALYVPLNIAAAVIAVFMTALFILIASLVNLPEFVSNNMCGYAS